MKWTSPDGPQDPNYGEALTFGISHPTLPHLGGSTKEGSGEPYEINFF